jgi:uroporphyrinogen III methyltransferase/synthase
VREFDKFSRLLAENGFEVINFPTIQTLPIADFGELNEKIGNLKNYDGLFFTSPKAAEVFLQNFENKESDFRGKIYVLGNRTKQLFENTNFEIVFRADANTAEEFINSYDKEEFSNKKLLFLKGDKSLKAIPELLRDQAIVDEIVVYQTIENTIAEGLRNEISERFLRNEIDWICFFSPSGIESFIKTFGEFSPNRIKIAAIGATTAKKAVENNLKIGFVSSKANSEDFAFELIDYIKNIE